ncbi:MAG: rhomboid family intramembrane serine protease [bacterium]|nr:rhomboid family intramembrane serine protease [bacterium]
MSAIDTSAIGSALELDRSHPWELWRWLTCHFAHFDSTHLLWSGGVFVTLLLWLEPTRRVIATVAAAAIAIPAAVLMLQPEIETYRGLSGLDSALFVLVIKDALRHSWRRNDGRLTTGLAFAAGVAFLLKLGYEAIAAKTVFVTGDTFVPVPLAHLVGAAVGLAAGARFGRRRMTSRHGPRHPARTTPRTTT